MFKKIDEIVGKNITVMGYKIEQKEINGNKVEQLTLLVDDAPNEPFTVSTTSKVMLERIKGMSFVDSPKPCRIITGESKAGKKFYAFESGDWL